MAIVILIIISTNLQRYFNIFLSYRHNLNLEMKRLSNEKFTPPYTPNESLYTKLEKINNSWIRLEFKGGCLKHEDKAPFNPSNVVNVFTVHELNR